MTILTMAQNIALETGFVTPTYLIPNSDEFATQILALIKKIVRNLSDGVIPGVPGSGSFRWQKLTKKATFNFVASQEMYTLPTDFKDFIPETLWDYTTRRPLITPIDAETYQIQKNYLITSAINKMVYVFGNQMAITPIPTSTDSLNYMYTTKNLYYAADGVTPQTTIITDNDLPVLDEYLIEMGVKFEFMLAKGMIPTVQYNASYEYQAYCQAAQAAMLKDGFGKPKILMNAGGAAYWMAAYTQNSDFPSS